MHGGIFPRGFPVVLMSLQVVVFAYAAIEMVGIAAGDENQSPFVTGFARLGVPASASVMNAVVLTAALSSTNSGLYSTGRTLRSLVRRGEASRFAARLPRQCVPYGGVLFTCAVYVAGVLLNVVVPQRAFDIATAVASLGVLVTWATILICQLRLRARRSERPAFRMPLSPASNWFALGILALVLGLMPFAGLDQAVAFSCIPVLAGVLMLGWRRVRVRASQPSSPRG